LTIPKHLIAPPPSQGQRQASGSPLPHGTCASAETPRRSIKNTGLSVCRAQEVQFRWDLFSLSSLPAPPLPARIGHSDQVELDLTPADQNSLCHSSPVHVFHGLAQGLGVRQVIIMHLPIAGNRKARDVIPQLEVPIDVRDRDSALPQGIHRREPFSFSGSFVGSGSVLPLQI